jgi:hypothetical protein
VQIHHVDGDPAHNAPRNLAVLCLDCHRETQITGGFDRKLDADQVVLYRDHWHESVRARREAFGIAAISAGPRGEAETVNPEIVTSLAEIYRENSDWLALARLYESAGNAELRDKYLDRTVDAAIEADDDFTLVLARRLQGRTDEVPPAVIDRLLSQYESPDSDWTVRQSLLLDFGQPIDAARVLARGILESLDDGRPFTAAFYLKRTEALVQALFSEALRDATEREDLWWQIRALQELGWSTELRALVEEHADEIEQSSHLLMKRVLAEVRGDAPALHAIAKAIAEDPFGGMTFVHPDAA